MNKKYNNRVTDHWAFDKRVPVVLVFTFIAQIFGFGWWASSINSRIITCENITLQTKNIYATKSWVQAQHQILRSEIAHNSSINREIKVSIKEANNKMDKIYNLLLSK